MIVSRASPKQKQPVEKPNPNLLISNSQASLNKKEKRGQPSQSQSVQNNYQLPSDSVDSAFESRDKIPRTPFIDRD